MRNNAFLPSLVFENQTAPEQTVSRQDGIFSGSVKK